MVKSLCSRVLKFLSRVQWPLNLWKREIKLLERRDGIHYTKDDFCEKCFWQIPSLQLRCNNKSYFLIHLLATYLSWLSRYHWEREHGV